VRNKAQVHLFAALTDVVENLPFPIRGIDPDYAELGSRTVAVKGFQGCKVGIITACRGRP
jgi:hypothetical protein